MSVRVAQSVWGGPAADAYRVAFLVLALAVVASMVGIARLPPGAGNHFIDRSGRPPRR